jgi:hypothetical protein
MRLADSAVGFTSTEAFVRVTRVVPERSYSPTSLEINALRREAR